MPERAGLPTVSMMEGTDWFCRFLNRNDSYENLVMEFPCLVDRKILFSCQTQIKLQTIQLYMIKVDVELVRFGILVDSVDVHKVD